MTVEALEDQSYTGFTLNTHFHCVWAESDVVLAEQNYFQHNDLVSCCSISLQQLAQSVHRMLCCHNAGLVPCFA